MVYVDLSLLGHPHEPRQLHLRDLSKLKIFQQKYTILGRNIKHLLADYKPKASIQYQQQLRMFSFPTRLPDQVTQFMICQSRFIFLLLIVHKNSFRKLELIECSHFIWMKYLNPNGFENMETSGSEISWCYFFL